MKAVILAGGAGTRLRPISANTPKPLVRLLDKPIMQYGLELLREHGFTDVMATLQTLPQRIMDTFGDGAELGLRLSYTVEDVPLGTAGGVKACAGHLQGEAPFAVMSGDAICDFDLTEAVRRHRETGAAATLLLHRQERLLDYGLVMTRPDGRVERFIEKPAWEQVFTNTVNTGVYLLNPEVLELVPQGTFYDFAKDLFPLMLKRKLPLYGQVMDGYWCDVGEPVSFLNCCFDLLDGRAKLRLPPQSGVPEGVLVKEPCFIAQGVRLSEGARLGPYAVLGAGSRVGACARVECSLLEQAEAGDLSVVEGAYVGRGTVLREGVVVHEGAVIGEDCVVGAHAEVLGTARIWPHKQIEAGERVATVVSGAGGRGAVSFDRSSLTGAPNIDLTPEFCLRLGMTAAEVIGPEAALSWQGGNAARLLAMALETGICAAGGRAVLTDAAFSGAAAYGAAHYSFPLTVFLRRHGDAVRMDFFGEDGLPLSRDLQRKLEAQTARGETRPAGAGDTGLSRTLKGLGKLHAEAAAVPPAWAAPGGQLTVQAGGRGAAAASLRFALTEAGCILSGKAGVPIFRVDEDGRRMSAVDESGQPILHGRLLALLLWLESRAGTRELALPYEAPAILDEMARSCGLRVLRLERDGAEAVRLYTEQRFMRDALFGLIRLTYGMRRFGLSLQELGKMAPLFFEQSAEVGIWADKGEIMRLLAKEHEDAELYEGIRTRTRTGWVHIAPLPNRRALRVTAESVTVEAAEEICEFFCDKIRRMKE